MEVFNTSKEAGPLWSHTRGACQSPEEADTLSAAGQRAVGAEPAGASLCSGLPSGRTHVKPPPLHMQTHTHKHTHTVLQPYHRNVHQNTHTQ